MNQTIITPDTLEDIKEIINYLEEQGEEYTNFVELIMEEFPPNSPIPPIENLIEYALNNSISHIYLTIYNIKQVLNI